MKKLIALFLMLFGFTIYFQDGRVQRAKEVFFPGQNGMTFKYITEDGKEVVVPWVTIKYVEKD